MASQIYDEIEVRQYRPNPQVRVLVEDMTQAICSTTNCPAVVFPSTPSDLCGHKRLAMELVHATIDHYTGVFERAGNHEAATLLRSEM